MKIIPPFRPGPSGFHEKVLQRNAGRCQGSALILFVFVVGRKRCLRMKTNMTNVMMMLVTRLRQVLSLGLSLSSLSSVDLLSMIKSMEEGVHLS